MSIITRNSEKRLPRLLAEAAGYADQILVGVDASSTDGTFDLASTYADTVYQFRLPLPGLLSPARILALQYADGDWILSLDDDEGMDPSFETLLPKLILAKGVTHHHFTRKWVVHQSPGEYLHARPWFPNWALRMFRNDRSLVWKPSRPHSQYYIQGPGHYELGTSILHFEPILTTQDERQQKIENYRNAGATDSEDYYTYSSMARRKPVRLRDPVPLTVRRSDRAIHRVVHELEAAVLPPWCSVILHTDLSDTARAGEVMLVEVTVRNTGALAWSPNYGWPTRDWPLIRLGYHLIRDGSALDIGTRTPILCFVAPGDTTTFVHEFIAPTEAGQYIIEWDMVNEAECWFRACGGTVLQNHLYVV